MYSQLHNDGVVWDFSLSLSLGLSLTHLTPLTLLYVWWMKYKISYDLRSTVPFSHTECESEWEKWEGKAMWFLFYNEFYFKNARREKKIVCGKEKYWTQLLDDASLSTTASHTIYIYWN